MAFEYTPYRSPFVGAIADLIGQRGDIAAQQALNEAKVRSQAVSSVAQSLGNLAQYQADAPKRRLEQAMLAEKQQQLADAQEARASKQSLATLLSPDYVEGFQPQGPTPVDASGEAGILPKSRSLVKDIGGVKQLDPDAIQVAMGQLGHGAWFLENRNTIDNLNKSMLDRYVLGQKAIQNAADLYKKAARRSQDTLDNRFKVQAAQTLVDALDNIIPGDQLEAIQKALGVGDTRMIDQFADQYAPDKVELVKTGPGDVITPLNQYGEPVGEPIQGAPATETTAQYNARVDEAFGTPEDQRTAKQQRLVDGVTSRAKALEATKRLPLNDEHVALLEKQKNGTLTPEETVRLSALDARAKLIPQFNVENRQEPSDREMTPNAKFQATRSLRNDYVRETRAARESAVQLAQMESSLKAVTKGTRSGDIDAASQGILVTFQKILDPNSVVRESEYARSAAGLSLLSRIQGAFMKIQSGGASVPVADLEAFVDLAREFNKNAQASARETRSQVDAVAKEYGIDPSLITRDYGDASETDSGVDTQPGTWPPVRIQLGQPVVPQQAPSRPVRSGR